VGPERVNKWPNSMTYMMVVVITVVVYFEVVILILLLPRVIPQYFLEVFCEYFPYTVEEVSF
jgi:hypothetical protein